MTDTDLPLTCQLGDCRNRAALTVTVELPADWSDSREYNVVRLQVGVCGNCAHDLEDRGRTLLAARVQYGRLREKTEDMARLHRQLETLVEAVGPPYEPVQGSIFARWLAALEKLSAQAAWRLLADVKRQTVGNGRTRSSCAITPSMPADHGRGEPAAGPAPIEVARFRRRVPVPPMEPPPGSSEPPIDPTPGGGDDAA